MTRCLLAHMTKCLWGKRKEGMQGWRISPGPSQPQLRTVCTAADCLRLKYHVRSSQLLKPSTTFASTMAKREAALAFAVSVSRSLRTGENNERLFN